MIISFDTDFVEINIFCCLYIQDVPHRFSKEIGISSKKAGKENE